MSCSAEASGYEGASYSYGTITPSTSVPSTSSEEADNEDSTLAPLIDVPTPVANQPNWWYVEGQYQIYRYVKLLNDKGVMTRTLTIER